MHKKAYIAVLTAAAALVGLSACAAPVSAPAARPLTATATPTPAPTFSGVACSGLLSDEGVSTLVGSRVGTVDPNLAAASGKYSGWLSNYAIEAVHGANCVWAEPGTEWVALYGAQGQPVFALQALPHALEAWTTLRPKEGIPGAAYVGGESFAGDCFDRQCHTDVLVGNWWLSADASSPNGSMTEHAFHDEVQKAVTALSALPEPAAVSVHNAIVDACGTDAYTAAVAESFGDPQPTPMGREFQFGMQSAVTMATATAGCNYQPSVDGGVGFLMSAWVIPDGKRLFGELAQLAGQKASVTEFGRVTANDNSDTSTFEYYALVGNDWVTIYALPGPDAQRQSKAFVDWLRATYA